jgi:hypothetical protein
LSFSPHPIHSPTSRFREIALHDQKKLKNIHEIVKKVYCDKAVTIIKKAKEGKPAEAAAGRPQEPPCKDFHRQYTVVTEVGNDWLEIGRKLGEAHATD